jgi:minimal PKS acyl carrier protein
MTENTGAFTEGDLLRILRDVAGADERASLDGRDVADVPVSDLGYDSLAILELAARTERAYGIQIPESDLENGMTPRQIVAYVNARRTEATA